MTIVNHDWLLFGVIMIVLLRLCFKDHSNGGGGYMDFSVLINFFWIFVTIAFVLTWGGIYWW